MTARQFATRAAILTACLIIPAVVVEPVWVRVLATVLAILPAIVLGMALEATSRTRKETRP